MTNKHILVVGATLESARAHMASLGIETYQTWDEWAAENPHVEHNTDGFIAHYKEATFPHLVVEYANAPFPEIREWVESKSPSPMPGIMTFLPYQVWVEHTGGFFDFRDRTKPTLRKPTFLTVTKTDDA